MRSVRAAPVCRGSELYTAGLGTFHDCVALLLQDGGPNDADGLRNGVISDPGAVFLNPAPASNAPSSSSSSGSGFGWFALLLLGGFNVTRRFRYDRRK